MKNIFIAFLIFGWIAGACDSSTVSQWRGQDRNGFYDENGLLDNWPEEGPEMIWSIEGIGDGFSSVSVAEDMIYVTGKEDTLEYLTAIDHTGNIKWKVPYGKASDRGHPEAKTTPNVQEGKAYVISCQGEVVCLDADNGDIIWKVDVYDDFEGYATLWGVCESPLIIDDKVFYMPGGMKSTMVALDKNTGDLVWASESLGDSTAYVSPIHVEYGGRETIVTLSANYLLGVDPSNGKIIWKYKYYDLFGPITDMYQAIINTNSPVYSDGQIYVTKGYNHLAAMFSLNEDASDVELMWTDSILDVHIGGVVVIDGLIYGANTLKGGKGKWCCLDWVTGEVLYETELMGKGSVITADEKIYFYSERQGKVALIEPSPVESKILSSFSVPLGNGPHWAHPVIRQGVLYIRHGDALMAYNILE